MRRDITLTRRSFLRAGALTGTGLLLNGCGEDRGESVGRAMGTTEAPEGPADLTIRIAPVLVELAPHRVISMDYGFMRLFEYV